MNLPSELELRRPDIASQVLAGLCVTPNADNFVKWLERRDNAAYEALAFSAVKLADALIRELSKQSTKPENA